MHKLFQMLAALVAAVTTVFAPHSERAQATKGALLYPVASPRPRRPIWPCRCASWAKVSTATSASPSATSRAAGRPPKRRPDFPQQSVSKLWVALATFQQIDEGKQRLGRLRCC